MNAFAVPPLPDLDGLADGSAWIAERDGLDEELVRLSRHAAVTRPRLNRQAAALAKPSYGPATLIALLRTLFRFFAFTVLGGLGELRHRLLRRGTQSTSSPAVRRAQKLVHAGGPAYVKVGQSIATAQGLLPDEWVRAFAWCRDEVPPLPAGVAAKAIEASFGRPIGELFAYFEAVPRAAASIAQVHNAVLHDGTEVVVKVQRPGLRARFGADLRVMSVLSHAVCRISPRARMSNPGEVLPVAAQLVLAELDFRVEALNMVHLALASEHCGTSFVRVPWPIPGMVTSDVLVMERVPGVPYTVAREKYGDAIDGAKLLRSAAAAVLEHSLMYGVFHGDLHSGNVLIDAEGGISLVDYGVCGRLDSRERASLVRLLIASMQRDSRGQVLAAAEMGALPAGVDLEAAIAEIDQYQHLVFEFTDASFAELDLTLITRQMRQVINSLMKVGFVVPKELVLFSRNLLYLNGFAAALAPEANMLAELENLLAHMTGKYPTQLAGILLGAVIQQPSA
ncbi:MAG: ABC1 kinase family protein [Sporichthyaceae bacterium]